MVVSIQPRAPIGTSLSSLVNGFILTQRTDCRSPQTIEYYEGILRRFLWFINKNKWSDDAQAITEWHIREVLAYVSSETNRWDVEGNGSESSRKKATYSTVHHYYCVFRAFFNWCVREGFLSKSPVNNIKMTSPKLNVVRPYTTEEIRKFLTVCDQDYKNNAKFLASRNKTIVLMLLDTGLRVSELADIKLADIDLGNGWIKVKGKGAKERVVRIGATVQKILWRYLIYRNKNDHKELWLTEERKPMSKDGIQIMMRRLKERAGITTEGNCHKFRHTFALSFLRQDRNPFNLQYLLGHSDLRMVKHYVSTLGMEDALKAHEKASPADLLGLR